VTTETLVPTTTTASWRTDFRLCAGARVLSLAGSAVTVVALPVLVYQLTGSATLTALLTALEILPYLMFGLVAGATADRADRKRLLVTLDLANTVLIGSIPLAAAAGALHLGHLFAVAVLLPTLTVWYDAASFGALPMIVPRAELTRATTRIFSMNTVALVVGPTVAGALIAAVGPGRALAADALSYLGSALLLRMIATALRSPAAGPDEERLPFARRVARDAREGLRFIFGHPLIRAATLLAVGISATAGAVLGLNVVYAVRALGVPSDDPRIGLLFTAGAVGALAATLLLPRLAAHVPAGRITVLGLTGCVALLAAYAAAPDYLPAIGLYLLFQCVYTLVNTNGFTLRQYLTPDALQGRVNTYARMITMSGQPVGALLGGLLAETLDVRTAIAVMTVPIAVSAAAAWFSPLRTSRVRTAHGKDEDPA
jgi:MFS family permease